MGSRLDPCRIAVLHSAARPFCTSIIKHLSTVTLPGYAYSHFPATFVAVELEKGSIQNRVLGLMEKRFDVIVTIGRRATLFAKEILDAYGGFPQIGIGVGNPVECGLVASLDEPGDSLTAIIRKPPSFDAIGQRIALLGQYRKSVLIPYEQGTVLSLYAEKTAEIASSSGMTVILFPIAGREEILMRLKDADGSFDTVVFLEGCLSGDIIREAADFCWERDILLCGNGLESIRYGASCAFGGDMKPYVDALFDILTRYWQGKTPMGLIPVTVLPDNQKFIANVHMLRAIGMTSEGINHFINSPLVDTVRIRV